MNLSPNFTWREVTASRAAIKAGISNQPPAELHEAIRLTAHGLERIRDIAGRPIIVTSWYRSPAVNRLVGGSPTSQHVLGEAADIECHGMSASDLATLIEAHRDVIRYDQMILEYPPDGWVHVSFVPASRHPRLLALTRVPGEYLRGVHA